MDARRRTLALLMQRAARVDLRAALLGNDGSFAVSRSTRRYVVPIVRIAQRLREVIPTYCRYYRLIAAS
jgi:hypothetical protein